MQIYGRSDMKRLCVLVIFGGCSPEYEVSLQSAYAVAEGLDPCKYQVILMGITREAKWYRFYGNVDRLKTAAGRMTGSICALP